MLESEQLADDKFDKIQSNKQEPSGILIGMDQADLIIKNKAVIQSPCELRGLRAYKSSLGPSKSGQKIIEQLITNSINSSQHAVTSFTTTSSNSSRVYPNNSEAEDNTSSLLSPAETGRDLTKMNKENKF